MTAQAPRPTKQAADAVFILLELKTEAANPMFLKHGGLPSWPFSSQARKQAHPSVAWVWMYRGVEVQAPGFIYRPLHWNAVCHCRAGSFDKLVTSFPCGTSFKAIQKRRAVWSKPPEEVLLMWRQNNPFRFGSKSGPWELSGCASAE